MNLFRLFWRRPNPSRAWKADPSLSLEFDFDRSALCGAAIGDPVEKLSPLGPAEDDEAARYGRYSYFSRGLDIEAENGRVVSFSFSWDEYYSRRHRPYPGRLKAGGRRIRLDGGSPEADCTSALGEPWWRDDEPEKQEVILFYERGPVEWQVELRKGRLGSILVTSEPVMADPDQRRAYGVTREFNVGT